MKAKWASETIRCIRRANGLVVEDEDEILMEIGNYYTKIFTMDPQIKVDSTERNRVFSLISNKLTALERAILDKETTMDEVEVVIKTFKSGKLTGLDGMTVEVLQACWEWVGKTFLDVI